MCGSRRATADRRRKSAEAGGQLQTAAAKVRKQAGNCRPPPQKCGSRQLQTAVRKSAGACGQLQTAVRKSAGACGQLQTAVRKSAGACGQLQTVVRKSAEACGQLQTVVRKSAGAC